MKIRFICVGKTVESFLREGELNFQNRLKHYIPFVRIDLPDLKNVKNLSTDQIKLEEGKLILKQVTPHQEVILLDENGKQFSSVDFAQFLDSSFLRSSKDLVFIIGGPYGFSAEVYARSSSKISLSKMTFSHQMVRMIFLEQLYRALTIRKGEPYHHV